MKLLLAALVMVAAGGVVATDAAAQKYNNSYRAPAPAPAPAYRPPQAANQNSGSFGMRPSNGSGSAFGGNQSSANRNTGNSFGGAFGINQANRNNNPAFGNANGLPQQRSLGPYGRTNLPANSNMRNAPKMAASQTPTSAGVMAGRTVGSSPSNMGNRTGRTDSYCQKYPQSPSCQFKCQSPQPPSWCKGPGTGGASNRTDTAAQNLNRGGPTFRP